MIDLEGNGFALTSEAEGVSFDIDADGHLDDIGWTANGSEDAFVVLDRDDNGNIDDGGELFGDSTQLRDGTISSNGYDALRELDEAVAGGNANGFIDPLDKQYWTIQLWTDANHDGISQSEELSSLRERGVAAIALEYEDGPGEDEHGNVHAFSSHALVLRHHRLERVASVDVYFSVSPPTE